MANLQILDGLEMAVMRVTERVNTLQRPPDWDQRDEHSLWRELIGCMLGSKVMFEHAQAAARCLDTRGLLFLKDSCHGHKHFEHAIANALSEPIFPPVTYSGRWRRYRYPRLRANHIRRTAEAIYEAGDSIKHLLHCSKNSIEARGQIISKAVGVGPKQASLFLRNIGYAEDLAILDTHVLRYISLLRLIPKTIRGVARLAAYESIEEVLQTYAEKLSAKLSCLDTAIWVVMRVYQKEFA